MKTLRIAALAAASVLALASMGANAAPIINAIYTTYSSTGVPTSITISGTGLCTTTTCTTKPTIKLGGITLAGVTGTRNTGVSANLGLISDGDYLLTLTAGTTVTTNTTTSFPLAVRAKTTAGSAATVTVGTTTTGAAGTNASVSNTGTSTAPVLNFTIPLGATGAQGPVGADGAAGRDGINGLPGASGAPGLIGPQGQKGDPGASGPMGPQGPKGDTGTPAASSYRGMWNAAATYNEGDVVYLDTTVSAGGRFCLYLATPRYGAPGYTGVGVLPSTSSDAADSTSVWAAFDSNCTIRAPVGVVPSDTVLASYGGHYYQRRENTEYTTADSFGDAQRVASASIYRGLTGYLATITSAAESIVVATVAGTVDNQVAYIGGSDHAQSGVWRWISGPESGQLISTYTNWWPGEPSNNAFGTTGPSAEDALATGNLNDSKWRGQWWDTATWDVSNNMGFIVEYGGMPATYDLAATSAVVSEGSAITFIVRTKDVEWGTALPYSFSGIGPEDLAAGGLSGNAVVSAAGVGGYGQVNIQIAADHVPEGNEILTFSIGGTSISVTVVDAP